MANTKNGNTFFIDTQYSTSTDELAIKGVRVPYLFVSASSGVNTLVLSDSVTGLTKLKIFNLDNSNANGDTRVFDFREYPLLFPNGIKPTTVSQMVVTCVIIDPRS